MLITLLQYSGYGEMATIKYLVHKSRIIVDGLNSYGTHYYHSVTSTPNRRTKLPVPHFRNRGVQVAVWSSDVVKETENCINVCSINVCSTCGMIPTGGTKVLGQRPASSLNSTYSAKNST
jgi:hypothetical protein